MSAILKTVSFSLHKKTPGNLAPAHFTYYPCYRSLPSPIENTPPEQKGEQGMALDILTRGDADSHYDLFETTLPNSQEHISIRVGSRTEQGKRANNEDRFFVDEDDRIFLVADGMGGQEDGERASTMAAELIPRLLRDHLWNGTGVKSAVQNTIKETNRMIVEAGVHRPAGRRMGTTVVVAAQWEEYVYLSWIGDSRMYLIRGEQVKQITTDHTVAEALVRNGDLTPEQADKSSWKHILYKFLGNPEMKDRAEVKAFSPRPGDRLLLASDGLTNYVHEDDLLEALRLLPEVQTWVDFLVDLSLKRGTRDNVTCVAVDFGGADA